MGPRFQKVTSKADWPHMFGQKIMAAEAVSVTEDRGEETENDPGIIINSQCSAPVNFCLLAMSHLLELPQHSPRQYHHPGTSILIMGLTEPLHMQAVTLPPCKGFWKRPSE